MKSPVTVKILAVAQLLLAVAGIGLAVYVALLTHSQETLKEKDAADTIKGLWIGAAVLGMPSLLEGVLAVALMRRARWAWWIGMVLNFLLAATFTYSAVTERNLDSDDVILVLVPTLLCVLYLVPAVRQWFFGVRREASTAIAA